MRTPRTPSICTGDVDEGSRRRMSMTCRRGLVLYRRPAPRIERKSGVTDSGRPLRTPTIAAVAVTPQIAPFVLGDYQTNCHVVSVPGSTACWIVDCGFEPAAMLDHVRAAGLRPEVI